MTQFEALGLSSEILRSVKSLGFDTPTPIQAQAIPLVLDGHDVMGLAQTGTGKTAAFGLPLVHQLLAEHAIPEPKAVRALILAPTRELVNQITAHLRDYVRRTPLRINTVIGGASIHVQKKKLSRGSDILVATPGRLLDLVERQAVFLDTAKYLVLDEADQMLDMGFIHALRRIAKLVATPRQTLLFSATMPKLIEELARTYLRDPVRIEVSPPGRAADKVRQSVHIVSQRTKTELLKQCLAERPDDLSLVFARTKHGCEKLMKQLVAFGFQSGSIHGNKSQGQRERAIKAFRNGDIRVLVATDVAARGIDIPGVSHVYNFDLPEVPENYIHRIGRTARAGAGGEAVAFCSPEDISLLRDIEKLMGTKVPVASGEISAEEERANSGRNARHRRRGGNRPNSGNRSNQSGRGKPQRSKRAGGNPSANGSGGERPKQGPKKRGQSANSNRPAQNAQSKRRRPRRKPVAA